MGNVTFLFLGGREADTLESISKELGDATIIVRNSSRSRGRSGSSSLSYNSTARKLMTPDELSRCQTVIVTTSSWAKAFI